MLTSELVELAWLVDIEIARLDACVKAVLRVAPL